ncbi:MAG: NirD/YgiW/YdeI family stress tolerance protein [Herminiimonas sp.]|uniref:YgiW/YdeI family stress tolerance OB fold protein n=1 Tax=Herminiimonas sp. TaxID=1926289 RepID=UPI0027213EBA|nr:NirD/YgiW/YdeI family stress tolerance protein [Herminiimonas sp.]MDO9419207.1 NirD/YgiW/YdeI family stress tolerance protein [Herminiimonas sp.]
MKNTHIAALIIAVSAMGLSAAASAQYVGPSSQATATSIAQILKHPVDDQQVTLSGFLIKKVGNEKYIFSDGKSEIRVDIDDKHFVNMKLDAKTKVEIRGEVEKDFLETPEIDVDVLTLAK